MFVWLFVCVYVLCVDVLFGGLIFGVYELVFGFVN